MTAPALPGAAPDPAPGRNDPARLPPEGAIDAAALGQLADTMRRAIDCGCVNVGVHPATFLALVDLAARALGGDGEPVAWAVFKGDSYEWVHDDEAKARENERDGYRVVPLYTRPAATGDTGEVEKARAAFYEAAVKWAEASKRDLACRAPYSSQERVNARMGTVDAHLGALAAYDALLAATGGPDAR